MDDTQQSQPILRLNKFIAQCGVCTRREAVDLIKKGEISVNNAVEQNPFYELKTDDVITYKNEKVEIKEDLTYILFNKPKNTTIDQSDEQGRPNALDLIKKRTPVKVFPIGSLDKDATGLMLFTNDSAVIAKLINPTHEMKIVYQLILDREITESDLLNLKETINTNEAFKTFKGLDYVADRPKNELGIQLLNDSNHILKSLFDTLEIDVLKMDRVFYAGLTKKDLSRGWSRELNKKEVILLKHFV